MSTEHIPESWNGAELSAFIGGDKKECNGFIEESKVNWFLTRVRKDHK